MTTHRAGRQRSVRVGGLDLSVRRDLQEPDGGPPEGYPYKDEPVADAAKREWLFSEMLSTLHTYLDHRSDVMLSGDVFIFYRDENDRRRALAPDLFVVFGPDFAQYRDRYGLSLAEVGKPPDFILEVASPSTWQADLGYKRDAYHWIGAEEYWLFDPEGGRLYGQILAWEQRVGDEYVARPVQQAEDGTVWAHSPALGLDICALGERLRFYDPAVEQYMLSQSEEKAAREAVEAAWVAEQTAREVAEAALEEEQTARATAEAARAAAKAALEEAQTARATEQTAREVAEAARATAKASREVAETARASAEAAREVAETARAAAEAALEEERAARAAAEDEMRQLRAQLQRLRESGTAPG